jgi:hypothetical protein
MKSLTAVTLCCCFAAINNSLVAAFTAGKGKTVNGHQGYRHGNIEETLADVFQHEISSGGLVTKEVLDQVYFGNWLRDHSLLLTGTTLAYLPEPFLIAGVDYLAKREFGSRPGFEVRRDILGVQRSEEHLDNPIDQLDSSHVDHRFVTKVPEEDLRVEGETGMKSYLRHSFQYILEQIDESVHKYRQNDLRNAFRLLGNALHPVEDFYAHSNFVELTLRELGHRNVFPWVGRNTALELNGKQVYPLVTGCGGKAAFQYNALSIMKDAMVESAFTQPRKKPASWMGRAKSVWQGFAANWSRKVKVSLLDSVISVLNSQLSKFSQKDRRVFEDDFWTNPTHTQLAKDHLDHPLNEIAGYCASVAVKRFAQVVRDVWIGDKNMEQVGRVLSEIIRHPQLAESGTVTEVVKTEISQWTMKPDTLFRMKLLSRENAMKGRNHMGLIQDFSS